MHKQRAVIIIACLCAGCAWADTAAVNPARSPEAQAVIRYLISLQGKGILTGQHDTPEGLNGESGYIAQITGHTPSIWGTQMQFPPGEPVPVARLCERVVQEAIRQWRDGSIVQILFSPMKPGETDLHRFFGNSKMTEADFDKVVTPGTPEYSQYITELDAFSIYLEQLRDAKVPILWRPFQEMNGTWFWWGSKKRYADLWRITYDRLVRHHGLTNLIWLWAPNTPGRTAGAIEPYYPGSEMVDALGYSAYDNCFRRANYDTLERLAAGKPIGIAECGALPNIARIKAEMPYVFFMDWRTFVRTQNAPWYIYDVYANPYCISRDGMKAPWTHAAPAAKPVERPAQTAVIDDFEYPFPLLTDWERKVFNERLVNDGKGGVYVRNGSGNRMVFTRTQKLKHDGDYAMRIDYTIGKPTWAGAERQVTLDFTGKRAIRFWLKPDGSGRTLDIRFTEDCGEVWACSTTLTGTEPRMVELPLSAFKVPAWYSSANAVYHDDPGVIDPKLIRSFGIVIMKGSGPDGNGTIYLDSIETVP